MNIRIECLERDDFSVIVHWIDPRLFRVFRRPIDETQLERLLTRHRNGRPTDIGLKAVAEDDGKIVGFVHAVLDWRNELAHIQQILVGKPELRRKGVGSAMMQEMLRRCFEEHELHRVQLFVDEDNEPAVTFYRKLGFKIDGLMREATKVHGHFLSWYCMSLLAREWDRPERVENAPYVQDKQVH